MPSTYSEYHKKSYAKRRDNILTNSKTYYQRNRDIILAKKREAYSQKKAAATAITVASAEPIVNIYTPPEETAVQVN
jgi:hypothetical protein